MRIYEADEQAFNLLSDSGKCFEAARSLAGKPMTGEMPSAVVSQSWWASPKSAKVLCFDHSISPYSRVQFEIVALDVVLAPVVHVYEAPAVATLVAGLPVALAAVEQLWHSQRQLPRTFTPFKSR